MTIEPSGGAGGYLHLLPFQGCGMVCTAISAAVLPWGSPSFMGVVGHAVDDENRAILEIGYEWPVNWLRNTHPLTQEQLEWLHVQRFRSDYVLATRSHPFFNIREGPDPPDILADTG